ncbi:hypothetical protein AB0L53_35060 [Nonomuraea sp. NPDC052129]|uniref:hypothetical protein n=1 Tax=Nonomuraea sp. NPDC052129 TaxID=3154651 RepID=UPI003434563D
MHATGVHTIAELIDVFSVGRATVDRVLDREHPITHRKGSDMADHAVITSGIHI